MFPQKTTKTPFLDDGSSWWTVLTVGTFPVSSSYSGGWGGGRERGRLACGERAVQRAGRGWRPAGFVCGWLMETQRAGDLPDNAQAPAAPGRRRDATFFLLGKGPAFSPLPPDRASHPVLGPPRGSAAPRLPPQQCSLGLGLGRAEEALLSILSASLRAGPVSLSLVLAPSSRPSGALWWLECALHPASGRAASASPFGGCGQLWLAGSLLFWTLSGFTHTVLGTGQLHPFLVTAFVSEASRPFLPWALVSSGPRPQGWPIRAARLESCGSSPPINKSASSFTRCPGGREEPLCGDTSPTPAPPAPDPSRPVGVPAGSPEARSEARSERRALRRLARPAGPQLCARGVRDGQTTPLSSASITRPVQTS